MIRLNERSVSKSKSLNLMYTRAQSTLQALCRELYLNNLADKIALHYEQVRVEWFYVNLIGGCENFN